jgi:Fe-S-cluster containining protein
LFKLNLARFLNRWLLPLLFPDGQEDRPVVGKYYTRTGACNGCGVCCKDLVLSYQGETVKTLAEFEQLKARFEEYQAFVPKEESAHGLVFDCAYLQPDNQCGQYQERPVFCRRYPTEHVLLQGGKLPEECSYQFKAKQAFDQFLK